MSAQFQNIFKATFPYHWGEFDFFELLLKEERRRHYNTGFHHKNHGLFLGTKKTCQQSKKSKWKSLSPPSKQIKKKIKRLYRLCLEFFGQFWAPTYSKTFVQLAGCLNIIRAAFFKLKQNIIAIVYLLVHSDRFKGILVPICGNFCISASLLRFSFSRGTDLWKRQILRVFEDLSNAICKEGATILITICPKILMFIQNATKSAFIFHENRSFTNRIIRILPKTGNIIQQLGSVTSDQEDNWVTP